MECTLREKIFLNLMAVKLSLYVYRIAVWKKVLIHLKLLAAALLLGKIAGNLNSDKLR
jgi:hypothetical protein